MISRTAVKMLGIAALLAPVAAQAHPGHEDAAHPLVSGLLHPLTGADHLAAMVMVGVWGGALAGRGLNGRARWGVPGAFVGAMVAGFAYGLAGQPTGGAEWAIVLSVLALGCALLLQLRAPLAAACAVTGAFGFAHGMAHGAEAPAQGIAAFTAGFVASTAALHVVGVEIARRVPGGWVRALGAIGAGFGLVLLAG